MLNELKKLWQIYLLSATLILLVILILIWPNLTKPTGLATSRAFVYWINPANCSIPLEEGWNLFSTPCYTREKTVSQMLEDIDGLYSSVHVYVASDSLDPWKAYNPSLPNWVVQDLATIDETHGYWINMRLADDLDIIGQKLPIYTILMEPGWNSVGYPSFTIRAVNRSLSDLYPYWRITEYFNATDDTYRIFYNSTQSGTFSNISPYFGYWIYMTNSGTWEVN